MSTISVKVGMSAKALAVLAQVPVALRQTLAKRAVKSGGEVVLREMVNQTPIGDPRHNPGKKPLRETEGLVVRTYGGQFVVAVIGPQYPAGAHGHLVAAGTKAHQIKVKSRGAMVDMVRGQFLGSKVDHPGARAFNFLQAAIDVTAGQVDATIMRILSDGIETATKAA